MPCIRIFVFILLLLSFSAYAQAPQSDVTMDPSMSKEIEVETQAQEGVPGLFDNIEAAIASVQKNNFAESRASVDQARKEIAAMLEILGKNPEYKEVYLSLEKIDLALQEANMAIESERKPVAVKNLNSALRFAKSLAASPVLKLTATKVSLSLANKEIAGGNFPSAGIWLERAINSLTSLLNNPNINQQEINTLKNDIVIAHQQVMMGKLKDKSYLGRLYDRASAATTNAMYQYYDMWTMNPNMPWSWY
jgi:tetratricopeptide (TPR) repeat protein